MLTKPDMALRWIRQVNKHPNNWNPESHTTICSAHFIGNKKSNHPLHPSYIPTIFPKLKNSEKKPEKGSAQTVQRFERYQRRLEQTNMIENEDSFQDPVELEMDSRILETTSRSISCQTDDCVSVSGTDMTYFLCNLNNINGVCTAEVQVNIMSKVTADKSCEVDIVTNKKDMKDFSCDPIDQDRRMLLCPGFHGMSSIKTDEDLITLTGVTFAVYTLLLNLLPDFQNSVIDKKTKLLITLMKLKTGLRFSASSVIFQIHRTTVQRIFITMLSLLRSRLKTFIIWPSKETVKANMPEVFKQNYPDTRVIIDCTEIYAENPPQVKEKVLMYSDYKHGYTVKFLVGCTPCGFISFVSKCYGGRSSDCFITNDCGLIELLEPGDTVLADKGFPSIRTSVENKDAVIVMPPFLHNAQFSPEEVEETYNVASVRIHIERVIQRIKKFHIFDKLPTTLFNYLDDIVYVVCALVNVENPIIKQ